MALNTRQVEFRRAKVKARISALQAQESRAAADAHWFRSRAFAQYALQGRADRLGSALTEETYGRWLRDNHRREQVERLTASVAGLPDHAGTRVLTPHPARVALIADTFLYDTYEGTARITYLTPENFREAARESDVLIITSTWRGRYEDWHGTSTAAGLVRTEVIPAFREQGVPVIFYSKEDPPNYVRFRPLAQEADVVFTSAREKITDYQRDCPRAQEVRSLTFGVNPAIHNPVGSRRRRHAEVLFAGSWLSHKYPKRQAAARVLFDGVLDAERDLLILDRNSELGDPKYFFPREYIDRVGPGLAHKDLMKVQRTVDVHLNLNSVTDSGTMYANRVVELQAMGAFVLSNYSLAVNDLYPEVQLVDSAAEVPLVLDHMTGDRLYRAQTDGLRRVWEHDTAWQRMAEMLESVGAPTASLRERTALVPDGDTSLEYVGSVARRQSAPVDCLTREQLRARAGEYDVVVPVSETHDYSATHVRDLLNVFRFADVDIAAKIGSETAGSITSHADHELVAGATASARSALRTRSETDVLRGWLDTGRSEGRTYSTAPFGAGPRPRQQIELSTPGTPRLTVVVPVYNNGKHLVSKCFRSLQRSSIFDDMEILLIDDGSTDVQTVEAVKDLAARHPNVRTRFFDTGGSGSASRPRNEGLELAKAPRITYLDPDNEAVNDGYAVLMDAMDQGDVEFAIGDMVKLADTRRRVPNVKLLTRHLPAHPDGGLMVPDDALQRVSFQPMSIQALVADTEWLRAIDMHQPVGALGQDSFAFQQMLHGANRIATVNLPIHIYYGAVSRSMINTVGPGFYRKYLPLEEYRAAWLRQHSMYEDYCHLRADAFLEGWLISKYNKLVPTNNKHECAEIIKQICGIYEAVIESKPLRNGTEELHVHPRGRPLITGAGDTVAR